MSGVRCFPISAASHRLVLLFSLSTLPEMCAPCMHFRDEHVKALKEHLQYSSIVATREINYFAPDLRVDEMLS